MSQLSRSRSRYFKKAKVPPFTLDHELTIPDPLLAWGKDPSRAMHWARPWAEEVEQIIAKAPLDVTGTETLLSRLEGLVGEAVKAGRADLLGGLDMQTAEWLGLRLVVESEHGPIRIGPDPWSQQFAGAKQPEWTYGEVRAVMTANDPAATRAAIKAKEVLLALFPLDVPENEFVSARIGAVFHEDHTLSCVACTGPFGPVSLRTEAGGYCWDCWSELTSPMPEHLRKLRARAPKVKRK